MADDALLARLAAIVGRLAPAVVRAYVRAIAALRQTAGLRAFEEAVIAGDTDQALTILFGDSKSVAALGDVGHALRDAVDGAARTWARDLPPIRLGDAPNAPAVRVRLDVLHPATRPAVEAWRGEQLTRLTDDMKAGVRAVVMEGQAAGINPRVTARQLRTVVGLTEYDAKILESFRAQLASSDPAVLARALRDSRYDRTVAAAIRTGTPLSADQVDTYVAAYERRLRAWRAETVSRTATLDAARLAQQQVYAQQVADGVLDAECLTKTWVARLDGRERAQHHRMHRQTVPFEASYADDGPGGTGQTFEWPGQGQYNCRCVQSVRIWPSARSAARYVEQQMAAWRGAQSAPDAAAA